MIRSVAGVVSIIYIFILTQEDNRVCECVNIYKLPKWRRESNKHRMVQSPIVFPNYWCCVQGHVHFGTGPKTLKEKMLFEQMKLI